jgi:Fe-S-cluster-containing dehydrogenase component
MSETTQDPKDIVREPLWKSWERQAQTSLSSEEFAPGASEWPLDMDRRSFLSLAAASLAAAGFSGCTRVPLQKLVPYVETPEGVIPGKALHFATGWSIGGQAQGLLIESQLGRPVKVDGNPLHPASKGKASAIHQALLASLYDENRKHGKPKDWENFASEMTALRKRMNETGGKGIAFLTEISTSPTLISQFKALQKTYPRLQWIQYEPVSSENADRSSKTVFGVDCKPVYQLDKAEVVVCLDADIFGSPLYPLRYPHDFFKKRSSSPTAKLFVVEPTPSITGAWTSNRMIQKSSELPEFAQKLFDFLTVLNGANATSSFSEKEKNYVQQILQAVRQHPGHCGFFAGSHQPEAVHELCHLLNFHFGKEVVSYRASASPLNSLQQLKVLTEKLQNQEIDTLFIIGGNPVYQAPADIPFAKALKNAKTSYRFSLCEDETSVQCSQFLPLAHDFEAWGDSAAFDGSVSVQQPMIAPLFNGKNSHEILSVVAGNQQSSYDLVKGFWQKSILQDSSVTKWEKAVQTGIYEDRHASPLKVAVKPRQRAPATSIKNSELEILIRPDSYIWDGRFSSNLWLQELPRPISMLTWGNAAFISPALAKKRNLKSEQVIQLSTTSGGSVKAPVFVLPGQEENTITLHLGYGRTHSSPGSNEVGFNAYPLWNSMQPYFTTGTIETTSQSDELACTQTHSDMNVDGTGKDLFQTTSTTTAKPLPEKKIPSLYEKDPLLKDPMQSEAWAMVINLDNCIGCNACLLACQSENNIPVVGKKGVLRGREMHWIRIDRYFSGNENDPRIFFQPVPCMQCEKAPCEEVCPVAATVHSTDGINQMIYNRCVGTRYCANNCPYKVRRFNFFSYTSNKGELKKLIQNPEVSVRPRGVMEKCTYCVQRVNSARIDAQKEMRAIKDGEIKTACQVTCPTEAITFGNKNDPSAQVSLLRKNSRHYVLLEELGTKPRTTYLAKIDDRV